ncbi:Protein of unknown function [Cotesia congregata]|uniref:Uncharacterized protein n=1 Tax=Cotesia congregata TaxID=51543 RepID=A0A8J2MQL7_COTCN|nr:Protein of unknown function [Cotesia congregata]
MPRRRKVSRNKSAVNSRLSSEEPTRMSENRRESVEADEPPVPNHVDKNSSTSNGKTDVHELDYEENELEQLIITRLFNDIRFSDDVVSVLPDRSWAIHCTEEPVKRIVVSEISMVNFHGRGFEPFYVKQVNNNLYKPAYIKSITDFESLLDYVSGVKLCAGGPEFTKYSNVSPECAYKDPYSKWRHNLCTLEVHDADVCEACESLDEILKRHSQRTKSPLKSRNNVVATKRKKF